MLKHNLKYKNERDKFVNNGDKRIVILSAAVVLKESLQGFVRTEVTEIAL